MFLAKRRWPLGALTHVAPRAARSGTPAGCNPGSESKASGPGGSWGEFQDVPELSGAVSMLSQTLLDVDPSDRDKFWREFLRRPRRPPTSGFENHAY